MSDMRPDTGDTDDLEALFDSIVNGSAAGEAAPAAGAPEAGPVPAGGESCCQKVFSQLGQVTRALYHSLNELGCTQDLEQIVASMPDAQERLKYISEMTERAAERALSAAEAARPHQQEMEVGAAALGRRWDALLERKLGVDEFKALVMETRGFLGQVPEHTRQTNAQLTEVIMAQDFQDLTGQVIKRVVDLVCKVESELVRLLVEASPQGHGAASVTKTGLEGPVVNADGRSDVVGSQKQVDELLESLGF